MKIDYPFVGRYKKRPMVPLNIINPYNNQNERFNCLLDTGADTCLFNSDVAVQLGHNLTGDGVKSEIAYGISGDATSVYLHTFIIELLDPKDFSAVWKSNESLIRCGKRNDVMSLLGTDDFLSEFTITFDYINQLATLYC